MSDDPTARGSDSRPPAPAGPGGGETVHGHMPASVITAVRTRQDFAQALRALRQSSGLSVRGLARATGLPSSTLGAYFAGTHLPSLADPMLLARLLAACGVTDSRERESWEAALHRVRARSAASRLAIAPYRGLAPYGQQDAAVFFGREELTARLLDAVVHPQALGVPLIVVGASGVGKSSVLGAGLVPAWLRSGRSAQMITPGRDPFQSLAEAVRELTGAPAVAGSLLVVDQFEELLTWHGSAQLREDYVTALTALAADGLRVVVAVRADFTRAAFDDTALGVGQHDPFVVGPMDTLRLRRAIEGPANVASLAIETALVDLLLHDAVSAGPGTLPLVSAALQLTWERRRGEGLTVSDYLSFGGTGGWIATAAESVYEELPGGQRDAARSLFLSLLRMGPSGTATRRSVSLAELEAVTDAYGANEVVERFVAARTITVDRYSAQIAHEALIFAWPRLRDWVNTSEAWLTARERLADAASRWRAGGRRPGQLLRGALLAQARELAADPEHGDLLTDDERELIAASAQRHPKLTAMLHRWRVRRRPVTVRQTGQPASVGAVYQQAMAEAARQPGDYDTETELARLKARLSRQDSI